MSELPYQPAERRPIAARKWAFSRGLASWLARRGVAPNAISVFGMFAAVAAGCLLVATAQLEAARPFLWIGAAAGIVLRLLANMLDGMVAVESGRASAVGELFNEVPDRISDAAVLVGLGYAHGSEPVLGYLAALLAVFTAYVRAVGKVAGAPQFFQGPMAKPQRMWLVVAVCLGAALFPAGGSFEMAGLRLTAPTVVLALIALGCVVTAARRLALIGGALRGKSA